MGRLGYYSKLSFQAPQEVIPKKIFATRLVLMRKVKYGQYDEMVQRFFKGRKQKQKVRNESWLCPTRKLHAGAMWQIID